MLNLASSHINASDSTCNRPHNGIVADCMRRYRALYHYVVLSSQFVHVYVCYVYFNKDQSINEIRRIRKNEKSIIRDRIADALLNDPRRSFWTEVRKIRNKQSAVSSVIDGCNDLLTYLTFCS